MRLVTLIDHHSISYVSSQPINPMRERERLSIWFPPPSRISLSLLTRTIIIWYLIFDIWHRGHSTLLTPRNYLRNVADIWKQCWYVKPTARIREHDRWVRTRDLQGTSTVTPLRCKRSVGVLNKYLSIQHVSKAQLDFPFAVSMQSRHDSNLITKNIQCDHDRGPTFRQK